MDVAHEIVAGDDPGRVLLDYCHEHGFDLIITGHHRAGRVGRLLLEGLAPELVAKATVPVLAVGEAER